MAYDHKEIEKTAREKWADLDLYTTDLSVETEDPYYLLVEFPYPSGDLHIGHWYAFAVTDIYARLLRARGKKVLFPIGFDAFGLPAENAAIKNGADPAKWTYENIARMREQISTMGASFDWSKEVLTCDPGYYQWTQWLFTKFFEHSLAERREAAVKWCPKDQTVLANEQVIDGACERCGTPVEEKRLTQWFLKITDYAERLLTGLDTLPWREEIKEAQRAWIGKSEGAKLRFDLGSDSQGRTLEAIEVFTTRPETVFGATYIVLAPEHALVSELSEGSQTSLRNAAKVKEYVEATRKKTERERSENKEKTGVKLEGVMAVNPATKEEIPIYVADYVLGSYGTGAVMAVPAHDERDFEFAKKMGLPIKKVIARETGQKRESEEFRNGGAAVVFDPASQKYAIALHDNGKPLLFAGGVNEGENVFDGVIREVQEESGLCDFKRVEWIETSYAHYFNTAKKVNRVARAECLLIILNSVDARPVALEEHEKFTLGWMSAEEIREWWLTHNEGGGFSHYVRFLDESVARAIELGFDTTSDPKKFIATPFTDQGTLENSGEFTGRESEEAKWHIVEAIGGERATQYRLRDWLVSRQRYWGCPIPIVYDPSGKPHAVPAEHLPWLLPTDVDFTPTGKAPLASSRELRERVEKIFGEGWTPEYDTLDTFVDSSWYFLRYLDTKNTHDFSSAELMKTWLPINRYSGGSEHTTMHVLYARFFMQALYDLALVPVKEPFAERFNRGLIMGPDGAKMSKSRGNVINPDDFVKEYGADSVRMYLAFIGPYNEPRSYPWNLDGVASMRKFLDRVARLAERASGRNVDIECSSSVRQTLAKTAHKIAQDGDRFKFNTAVAALMILVNELEALPAVPKAALEQLVVMLAPFAPHLAEHLWAKLGGEGSVHQQSWPTVPIAVESEVEVVVQVAGRRKGSVTLPRGAGEAEAVAAALKIPPVAAALIGKKPKRIVYVQGKIINMVV